MKKLRQILFTSAMLLLMSAGVIAQTCVATPPVCVPGNGFAFQFAGDTDHGLKFNTGNTDYEYTNNIGNAVFGVDAFTGNISIPGGGALQVGPNRYAFQFTLTPNYGLFFNAAGFAYEFRTANASPIMSIGANSGNVTATGSISAGNNVSATNNVTAGGNAAINGNVNTNGNVNATSGNVSTIEVNASGTITGTGTATLGDFAVKGLGANVPTSGYLGVIGSTNFDGEDSLDIPGQEIGVLGVSTGGSIVDNYGVAGFSNNIAVRAAHQLNDNRVDLATPTHAISATGNTSLTGEFDLISDLNNSAGIKGPLRLSTVSGIGIAFDANEVQSYINATTAGGDFFINYYGGNVNICDPFGGDGDLYVHGNTFHVDGLDNEVGIGTSLPSAKLDVVGTSELNGAVDINGTLDVSSQADFNGDVFVNNQSLIVEATNANINVGGARSTVDNVIGDAVSPTTTLIIGDEGLYMQGNLEVGGLACKTGGGLWAVCSDARLKKEVTPFSEGLDALLQVEPVKFKYNNTISNLENGREYVGIIAQDMQKIAPYMIEETPVGRKIAENPDGSETVINEGTNYLTYDGTALMYILVNAVKELHGVVETLEEKVLNVQDQSAAPEALQEIRSEMDQLKQDLSSCCMGMKSENEQIPKNIQLDDAWLGQNIPNPFDNSTIIQYYTPESVTRSEIRVHDIKGQEIKIYTLNKGYGEVKFNDSDISSGTYIYSLINDGVVMSTKKMVLNR